MSVRRSIILFVIGLVLIALGEYLSGSTDRDVAELISEIESNVTREILEIENEASSLMEDSTAWNIVTHSFFLMDSAHVLRWNKNDFLPDLRTVQDDFSLRLLQWPRGIFL
ncbi:MAG: hypothetical protein RIA63_13070, partial [Cyclobacteriaceae bacterium]